MDTGIVLHRWTLTMNTMTLSSTGQYWTATPGFADVGDDIGVYILLQAVLHEASACTLGQVK